MDYFHPLCWSISFDSCSTSGRSSRLHGYLCKGLRKIWSTTHWRAEPSRKKQCCLCSPHCYSNCIHFMKVRTRCNLWFGRLIFKIHISVEKATQSQQCTSLCYFPLWCNNNHNNKLAFLTLFLLSVWFSLFVAGKKKEKRSKIGEEGRGKRNAIRLHEAYTVETVVVADSDMVQYHGAEAAQRFLLTVMNMVKSPRQE